jgi:hypothetical protein
LTNASNFARNICRRAKEKAPAVQQGRKMSRVSVFKVAAGVNTAHYQAAADNVA